MSHPAPLAHSLSVAAWMLAVGATTHLLWKELAPHVRQARRSLAAAGAWSGSSSVLAARWQRRLVWFVAAGTGTVTAFALVLLSTGPLGTGRPSP